ncbi:MAG TPA: ABC transporter substrate-binding protein [Stellaceae bacterium]|jgi:ABC-type nitrate/sulfonate/bicarbonate transport system substrate-binding protein|nr:ABC transporter substrate-binding protein [Stellaceae bacterium]
MTFQKKMVAGALALGLVAVAGGASAAQLKIGKADSTDYDFALLQVGIDAGIFKKDNLELETVTLPGAQLHQAMTANSIDMALGSGTDFQFIAKGAPEKGVAAFAGAPINLAILVRMDGKINKVDDLKGRVVAVSTNGSLTYWLTTELNRRLNWTGNDAMKAVATGALEAQVAALRAGNVDGVAGNIETGYRLEAQGQAKSLVPFGKYINPFITHVIYATDNMMQNHPDQVRAFLKGWFDTIAFMKSHQAETLASTMPITKLDEATAKKVYEELMPMFLDNGRFDPKGFAVVEEAMKASGVAEIPPKDKLYTEEFLPK